MAAEPEYQRLREAKTQLLAERKPQELYQECAHCRSIWDQDRNNVHTKLDWPDAAK